MTENDLTRVRNLSKAVDELNEFMDGHEKAETAPTMMEIGEHLANICNKNDALKEVL